MKSKFFLLILFSASLFFAQTKSGRETLALDWPDEENWVLGNRQESSTMEMIELVKQGESLENWTELGTMISIKGAKNVGVENMMNLLYNQTKPNSPSAKLTFIEKGVKDGYPWILFKIECPQFNDDPNPESQLWYIVQGSTSLFTNNRAIKKKCIPKELEEKWGEVFKLSKIIYD